VWYGVGRGVGDDASVLADGAACSTVHPVRVEPLHVLQRLLSIAVISHFEVGAAHKVLDPTRVIVPHRQLLQDAQRLATFVLA